MKATDMSETVYIPIKRHLTEKSGLQTCGGCDFYAPRNDFGDGYCQSTKYGIANFKPHANCPVWSDDAVKLQALPVVEKN